MRRAKGIFVALVTLCILLAWQTAPRAMAASSGAVSREQFIVDLAQELHLQPLSAPKEVFPDLTPSDPSYRLVMAAYQAGWISGFPNGTFQPNGPLTREQVAKCEIIALGLQSAAAALAQKTPAYGDAGSIGRWAWGDVNEAAAIGILRGFSQASFGPQQNLTSPEISHVNAQLVGYLAKAAAKSFAAPPTAAAGGAVGTTSISATPNTAGDRIAVEVSTSPIAPPTWNAELPSAAAAYVPGDDLSAAPNDYVGVYEVRAAGTISAFSQLQLASDQVTQAPAALTLTGPASAVASASASVGPFSVSLTDVNGHPVAAPAGGVAVALLTDSSGGHEFAQSASGSAIAVLTIPAGSRSATFYYGSTLAGQSTLTAQSPSLSPAALPITVTAAAPSGLTLAGPPTMLSSASAAAGPFSVSLSDAYGNTSVAPAGGLSVTLGSSSPGTHEFSLTPGGPSLSQMTILAGASSGSFYYGDSQPGTSTIYALSGGVGSANLQVAVSANSATGLSLSGPQTGSAGATATNGPFTVTLTDASGNPVSASQPMTVSLGSSSPAHEFAASSTGPPAVAVMIPAGSSSASFYYGDDNAGQVTLSASVPGVGTASQQFLLAVPMPLVGQGLDSSAQATPSQVQAWRNAGFSILFLNTFAPNFAQQYANSLSAMQVILFQGYYTSAFTGESGAQRAQSAIAAAQSVGYPQGAYIFVDVESTGSATQQQMIEWIDSWASAVQGAGYGAGVYFGVPQPVSASAAYGVAADRFWESLSGNAIVPSVRGVCVVQTGYNGVMDEDTFGMDNLGEYCIGAGT